MTLGERIARLRRSNNWTQDELAARVGAHPRHISRLERDRNRPSEPLLDRLAGAFDMSREELLRLESPVRLEKLLPDPEILRQFEQVRELDEEDRQTVFRVIQAFATKKRMENVLGGYTRAAAAH